MKERKREGEIKKKETESNKVFFSFFNREGNDET
jgi:hypothetical protein